MDINPDDFRVQTGISGRSIQGIHSNNGSVRTGPNDPDGEEVIDTGLDDMMIDSNINIVNGRPQVNRSGKSDYERIKQNLGATRNADAQFVEDEIQRYLSDFPQIFSFEKQRELVSQFKFLLNKAKAEKFGTQSDDAWSCLEIDDKMSLIPSRVSKVTDGTLILDGLNTNIQDAIGKKVETESGESGLLICSNGMGIQPLDLFNDIMTTQRDLQNFLGDENYKPTDGNIALSIKAYLKFCAITKYVPWSPDQSSGIFMIENIGHDIKTENTFEEYPTEDANFDNFYIDEQNDASLTEDEEPPQSPGLVNRRLSPKKVVKIGKPKGKRKDDDPYDPMDTKKRKYTPQRKKVSENEIAVIKVPKTKNSSDRKAEKESVEEKSRPLVLASCKLCDPNTEEYAGSVRQNLYDRIMSKHMMDDHDLTDDVMALKSFERKMMDYLTEENHNIEQGEKVGMVTCRAHPKCTYGYEYHSKVHKLERISFHVYYHSELEKHGKSIVGEDGDVTFPCPYCDHPPFPDYVKYKDHKNNKHPDFQFKCRFPGCVFKSWSMRSRQTHWDDKHGKRSTPLPCEICGKTYIDLKKHMEYHLKPNEMTCDLCGKSFPSKARFDFHYKQTHDKTYPCPQCGQLFNRMQNVVNHQVFDHGMEKPYGCKYCPSKFICKTNQTKHMEKYHSQGKSPQTRKIRGPNKNRMANTGLPSTGATTGRYESLPISATMITTDRNQTYGTTTLTLPNEVSMGQHIHTIQSLQSLQSQTVQSDTGGLVPIIKPDNHHM